MSVNIAPHLTIWAQEREDERYTVYLTKKPTHSMSTNEINVTDAPTGGPRACVLELLLIANL